MKIRIEYTKLGALRFIGHLDVMRFFQKANKRAGLDVAYSQGYSPHQLITFAAPLSLGVTSEGEYFDAEMKSVTTSQDMMERLNAVMPPEIQVRHIVALPEGAKTAMAVVSASDYKVSFTEKEDCPEDILAMVELFKASENITVLKKTKTKETEVNIRPFVYDIRVEGDGIYILCSTGSIDNIKPELVMASLYSLCGREYSPYKIRVHRYETYFRNEMGELRPLYETGTEITE